MTELAAFVVGVAVGLAVAWYLGDRKRKRDLAELAQGKADTRRSGRAGHALDKW